VASVHQKALRINLDASKYGTFAEIGGGQEVARWFFYVGGASGTVAKTISAYDMEISDAIYGASDRYVSRQRLRSMLDYEFDLLVRRLRESRGAEEAFFAFADTVATRSYSRKEDGHGWIGIRFQHVPQAEASEILVHVRLHDSEGTRQQEALGILGVNLIHGAFYEHANPATLIHSLMDNLTRERVELDMIRFSGPAFDGVDNRLMSLQLVQQQFTDAAMFTAEGEVVHPEEVLYKKSVLVERGSFRPVTNVTYDMLECAREQFCAEAATKGEEPVVLMEMTLRHLVLGDAIDHQDFLDRVDVICSLGWPVLISNFGRYYRLVNYLTHYTRGMIGLPLGITRLRELLDEKFYEDLDGGLLEALGQLFKNSSRLYVHPAIDRKTGRLLTLENLDLPQRLRHLFRHLVENRHIEAIRGYDEAALRVYPKDVLARIQEGDPEWEKSVPAEVARIIKRDRMFGYRQ
jgi:hypothetical protein